MRQCSILAVCSLTLFTPACSTFSDANDHSPVIRPVPVEVDAVRADPWPDIWETTGFLRRAEPVTLSSRMTGVVGSVPVKKDDRVKAGAVLVAFDTSDLDGNIKDADEAKPSSPEAIRKAGEAVEMARLNLGAAKSDEARKTARAALDRALSEQAALRTKSSGVDGARQAGAAMREAAIIAAPSAGRIGEVFAVPGKLLPKNTPLVSFEPSDLFVETSVESLSLGAAGPEAAVNISFSKSCEGTAKVLEISDSPIAGQKNIRTSLPPCRSPKLDAPGRVRFEGPPHPVVTVAQKAVITQNDHPAVFLVEDGFAKLRRITLGRAKEDRVEAIAGLAPGSKVVVAPPTNLKDNVAVVVAGQK